MSDTQDQSAESAAPAPWATKSGSAGTPWGKAVSKRPRATERLRKTITGLPDWEPLPPGEILARRGERNG